MGERGDGVRACNLRKGNKMPKAIGMIPITAPRQPSAYQLRDSGRGFPPNYLHEELAGLLPLLGYRARAGRRRGRRSRRAEPAHGDRFGVLSVPSDRRVRPFR